MGWNHFVAIPEEKTLISLGNKVDTGEFQVALEVYEKFMDILEEFNCTVNEELNTKKLCNLPAGIVKGVLDSHYILVQLSNHYYVNFAALDMVWRNEIKNPKFVLNEDDPLSEYKTWHIVF